MRCNRHKAVQCGLCLATAGGGDAVFASSPYDGLIAPSSVSDSDGDDDDEVRGWREYNYKRETKGSTTRLHKYTQEYACMQEQIEQDASCQLMLSQKFFDVTKIMQIYLSSPGDQSRCREYVVGVTMVVIVRWVEVSVGISMVL